MALKVEVFDTNQFRVEHEKLEAVVSHPDGPRWLVGIDVQEHEETLLVRDGRIVERLGKDRHVFWKDVGRLRFKTIDRREQIADVAGQEIMTSDKVTLRVNQVIEAEKAAQANLIKRREETAAARSQANTARLLAENPALARMKELELLQEVLAGAKATFVFGDGDIAGQVRRLIREDEKRGGEPL